MISAASRRWTTARPDGSCRAGLVGLADFLALCQGWGSSMPLVPGQSALVATVGTAAPARSRLRPSMRSQHVVHTEPGQEGETRAISVYVVAILGGAVLAGAWLVPETGLSAWLGGIAALLLVYAVRVRRAYLPLYFAGLVGHVIGFHWVYQTVRVFGGFEPAAAMLVFVGFVVTGDAPVLALRPDPPLSRSGV